MYKLVVPDKDSPCSCLSGMTFKNCHGKVHALSNHTDPVNSPSHYASSAVETIDAIEAWNLGFNLGNAVKYISRAGKKDPSKLVEDLKKAKWYLDRELSRLEKL
jgi:hypothetical protein